MLKERKEKSIHPAMNKTVSRCTYLLFIGKNTICSIARISQNIDMPAKKALPRLVLCNSLL